jgi:peptidoglycan/LPS O-acetylase OafA/YrhL
MNRILPISSIRFVLAMWVALSHFGLPFLHEQQQGILWAVRAFFNNAIDGPAAVIVFFVISGFCIHFPNRKTLEVRSWKLYYARRYLRILIPMTVAIAISIPLKMGFGLFTDSILWSLLCEEIYYFLYPALLILRDRIGWRNLMALAWAGAFLTILTNPRAGDYPSYGPALNWALGLPCWLLGCRLAERLDNFSAIPITLNRLWMWRAGAWALSVLASVLRFHSLIGFPWTFDLLAIYWTWWLEREIRYYHTAVQPPPLESLGEASYSIYLTHTHGQAILRVLTVAKNLSPATMWLADVILCGAFGTVFYWLVERPSHRLARRAAKQATWLRAASAVSTP